MKSPFPGMDPYLEHYWRSVHHNLITYAQEQLSEQLPSDLIALVGERDFVESSMEPRSFYPDVYVAEYPRAEGQSAPEARGTAVAEPIVISMPIEPMTQAYLEILEAGTGNRVATVIEFLSPSNKLPGEGRDLYVQTQKECLAARVNLVEIDLVRQGSWTLVVPRALVPPRHIALYHACVRQAWDPFRPKVYPLALREPLPVIDVPLRETDSPARLALQALLDKCYQLGRFANGIDYSAPLDPPLAAADASWAAELIRSHARAGE